MIRFRIKYSIYTYACIILEKKHIRILVFSSYSWIL